MLRNSKALLIGLLVAASASAQSGGPPAPAGEDWGAQLVDWTQTMVTNYGGVFVSDGITLLAWLAAFKVLWTIFLWGLDRGFSLPSMRIIPFRFPRSRLSSSSSPFWCICSTTTW